MNRKYNINLLNDCLSRDIAKLVGNYDMINQDSKITFICNCGLEGSKSFKCIYIKGGAFCKKCVKKNYIKKLWY